MDGGGQMDETPSVEALCKQGCWKVYETVLSLQLSTDCFGAKLISHDTVTEMTLVLCLSRCSTYFQECLETEKGSFQPIDNYSRS